MLETVEGLLLVLLESGSGGSPAAYHELRPDGDALPRSPPAGCMPGWQFNRIAQKLGPKIAKPSVL